MQSRPLNHLVPGTWDNYQATIWRRRMQAVNSVTAGEGRPGGRSPAAPRGPGRVLAAKLRAPRVDALPRERLDELLSGLWSRRLALVVAPAGSGKTTLLSRF